jgi:hypothetical protein
MQIIQYRSAIILKAVMQTHNEKVKMMMIVLECLQMSHIYLLCELQYKEVAPNEFPRGS